MNKIRPIDIKLILITTVSILALCGGYLLLNSKFNYSYMFNTSLLSDPFLQLPTEDSVRVVWFTEFPGSRHEVNYGENLEQKALATTTKLSKLREDSNSKVAKQFAEGEVYKQTTYRDIWRHEAEITDLSSEPSIDTPYQVVSIQKSGEKITSDRFTLSPLPPKDTSLKILLTSDHQLKSMTPANLQKVVETIGEINAVFFAGDLVNIPDRASEWFDDIRGNAFFPCLQGRANYELEREEGVTRYIGGKIIQSAPLFPAIGNHEVMGRLSINDPLNNQFNDPYPQRIAKRNYSQVASEINPLDEPNIKEAWIKDNSFNIDTYEEIFTLPKDSPGGEKYYAITFGDIRLISLYITNIWRTPNMGAGARGKYRERDEDLNDSMRWGYGQHIFESIAPGSPQYKWLQSELRRQEFQDAKYKIVMFHHPPHSLGDNIVPPFTDPTQTVSYNPDGQIDSVRYEYPQENDYLIRDVIPLLESSGIQLVFYGHSHLWNRFVSPSGMHFLESSNVGNTYGAYTFGNGKRRAIPDDLLGDYAITDNPNGLNAIVPNINPFIDEEGKALLYIASNDITVFSIFDTSTGIISSYRYDTLKPGSEVIKFDEFKLGRL